MSTKITDVVREKYGEVARSGLSSDHAGVHAVAEAFGYSPKELASIPAQANMGLSCGNPTASAHLRPGEVVVDLGSGGGLDVLLAAHKVGPTGRAIGVDMTPEMIELAKNNAERARDEHGQPFKNIEFHQANIDRIPLPDDSVDCVISNCVINLATDKPAVIREIARVLKPGGRLAVSDIALKKPIPAPLVENIAAYVGCISGAVLISEYQTLLLDAGFDPVEVVDTASDLNAYAQVESQVGCCSPAMQAPGTASLSSGLTLVETPCCSPSGSNSQPRSALHESFSEVLKSHDINDFAASVRIFALKPALNNQKTK